MATVKELQAQARAAGVSTRGSKAALERRLANPAQQSAPAAPARGAASPAQRAAAPPPPKREAVSLAKRQAEAQRKGYVGADASDLAKAEPGGVQAAQLGPQARSGVTDAPGGHPNDSTANGAVGAAR